MVSKFTSPTNENSRSGKKKYKKDALEFVDYDFEFKNDPKFKTELCKTYTETNFCAYGNKCRFAHGKEELFDRMLSHPKYRKSDCMTFHTEGFCNYGLRCHFRHNESINLKLMDRSYYYWKIRAHPTLKTTKRLTIFESITKIFQTNSDSKMYYFKNNVILYPNLKSLFDVNLTKKNYFNSRTIFHSQSANAPRTSVFSEGKLCESSSPVSESTFSPTTSMISYKNVTRKLNFNELQTDFSL